MIHPDATRDECLEEIGALEREIGRLWAIIERVDQIEPETVAALEREMGFDLARRVLEQNAEYDKRLA